MTKDEIIKALRDMAKYPTVTLPRDCDALRAAADLLAQPEQTEVQRLIALVRAQQITIDKLEAALAQPAVKEPVAFPRQAGDSTWIIDTAFIWRVKHTIAPDTPYDWTPSEEQIETVLLALEKIPSPLYTTLPQRTWVGLDDTDIGNEYVRFEVTKGGFNRFEYAVRAIETKLKEKNNG